MTPDVSLVADSADVTAVLRDRLLELTVTDEEGLVSDALELRLDDRAPVIALPRRGVTLAVSLGYRETGLAGFGSFVVDEVVPSGPPDTLTIRARAADLREGLKVRRSRSWHEVTLGALVAAVAAEHGYRPRVAPGLAALVLEHVDQTGESDLHLLTRLAGRYGAVAKPSGGFLLCVPRGQAKTFGGVPLPPVVLVREDLTRWDGLLADRSRYGAVTARYRDLPAAQDVTVRVGVGAPEYALPHLYQSHSAATHAAKAKLESLQRGEKALNFTTPGDVRLVAEALVTISGVRPGVDGVWVLERARHVYSAAGYQVQCQAKGKTL